MTRNVSILENKWVNLSCDHTNHFHLSTLHGGYPNCCAPLLITKMSICVVYRKEVLTNPWESSGCASAQCCAGRTKAVTEVVTDQSWDSCGSCRTSALVPTRHDNIRYKKQLEAGPTQQKSGGSQVLSGPKVTSEHVCPVPTETYVGCPRFDLTSSSEMGNHSISA